MLDDGVMIGVTVPCIPPVYFTSCMPILLPVVKATAYPLPAVLSVPLVPVRITATSWLPLAKPVDATLVRILKVQVSTPMFELSVSVNGNVYPDSGIVVYGAAVVVDVPNRLSPVTVTLSCNVVLPDVPTVVLDIEVDE